MVWWRPRREWQPLLLDQASSTELMQLASGWCEPELSVRPAVQTRQLAWRISSLPLRRTLPWLFLGLSAVTLVSLAAGTTDALGDGRLSRADVVRITVLALTALAVLARGAGVLRSIAAVRRLLQALSGLVPRRGAPVASEPPARLPLLLDQAGSEDLAAAVPPSFGSAGFMATATGSGRRAFWGILGLATMVAAFAFAVSVGAALSFRVGQALLTGAVTAPSTLLQTILLLVSVTGIWMLASVAWRGRSDARLRNPVRFFPRVGHQILDFTTPVTVPVGRVVSSVATTVAATGAVATPVTLAAMTAATLTVATVGLEVPVPVVQDVVENAGLFESSGAGGAAGSAGDVSSSGGGSSERRNGSGAGGSGSDSETPAPSKETPTPGAKVTLTPTPGTKALTPTPDGKSGDDLKPTPTPTSELKPTATSDVKPTATPTTGVKPTATPTSDVKPTATPTTGVKPTATATADAKP